MAASRLDTARLPSDRPTLAPEPPDGVTSDRAVTARGPLAEIEEAFAAGDFGHALAMAQLLLAHDPDDKQVCAFAESARLRLRHKHLARLGAVSRTPVLLVNPGEITSLKLDAARGFLLSQIDGRTTIEEILDLSPLPELDTLALLVELAEGGAMMV